MLNLVITWIKLVWPFTYKYLCEHISPILLGFRSVITWSYSKYRLNFIRNCQTIFQSICIILHSNHEINFCDLNLKGEILSYTYLNIFKGKQSLVMKMLPVFKNLSLSQGRMQNFVYICTWSPGQHLLGSQKSSLSPYHFLNGHNASIDYVAKPFIYLLDRFDR